MLHINKPVIVRFVCGTAQESPRMIVVVMNYVSYRISHLHDLASGKRCYVRSLIKRPVLDKTMSVLIHQGRECSILGQRKSQGYLTIVGDYSQIDSGGSRNRRRCGQSRQRSKVLEDLIGPRGTRPIWSRQRKIVATKSLMIGVVNNRVWIIINQERRL